MDKVVSIEPQGIEAHMVEITTPMKIAPYSVSTVDTMISVSKEC